MDTSDTAALPATRVVDACLKAWIAGDIPGILAFITDETTYIVHPDETTVPFGGQARGADAIRANLERMLDCFEYVLYRPFPLSVQGDVVRHRVEYICRSRQTGEEISGTLRLVWTIRDGKIVLCEKYQDAAKLAAFLRLSNSTVLP